MNRKNVEDIYPLSPLQEGMLFHGLYSAGKGAYVEQWPLLLEGPLDVDAFHRSLQRVVDRHPALRTAFVWENVPRPLQVVFREAPVPLDRLDWSGLGEDEWRARLTEFTAERRAAGFEMTAAPLLRITLIRLSGERHLLLFAFHHLLMDGWSAPLVFGDWWQLYEAAIRGETPHLPPAPRFRDYIAWLQAQDGAESERFWRQTLAGFTTPTPLPLDRGGPDVAEEHEQVSARVTGDALARLQALARESAVTFNTLVQAAWALLLSRYAGTDDVVFGATVSGRPAGLPGVEQMVGLFINTLPVRDRVRPEQTVRAWLADLQQRQVEARQHEHARLLDVQGWSEVPREHPLFGSLVVFENFPLGKGEDDGEGGSLRLTQMDAPEGTSYPLTLVAVPGAGRLELRLTYDVRRFSADAARRILALLGAALTGLAEDADRPVGEVPLLAPGERERLAALAADRDEDGWADGPVHLRVAAQAARAPERTAVEWEGGSLSYARLEARAGALAHRLVAAGVRPDARVALFMERAPEMVVGMLAVLKAGAAYVPVDPGLPTERLAWLLADADPSAVLAQARLAGSLPATPARVLVVDEEGADADAPAAAPPPVPVDRQSIAYVIYTSGSTGRPKGVLVPHGALAAHMTWMRRRFPLGADGAVLQKTPFGFDASVWEFWAPLLEGARLVLARPDGHRDPAYLVETVRRAGVTTLQGVPSLLALLAEEPGLAACTSLRRVYAGGEALTGELVRRLRARTDAEVVNLYGPTETCIDASFHVAGDGEPARVPIGRAVDGTRLHVLDAALRLLPEGAPGELCIGGAGLARGYLGRPALTAERFVPDPVSGVPGARLYRTGDRARWTGEGVLEFIGRTDFQVKIRGHRVEPGEVEAALAALPGVSDAAVVAREDAPGDVRLVAYATGRGGTRPVAAALREALARTLPEPMVPAAIVVLDALPLTANGKLDRAALPDPQHESAETRTPPETETEIELAELWSELLEREEIGADDSFFALGGHSLRAMQLVSRIRHSMDVELPLREVFEVPRLREMAAAIDLLRNEALAAQLAELDPDELEALLAAAQADDDQ